MTRVTRLLWCAVIMTYSACRSHQVADPEPKVLRTYEVPAGTAEDLASVVNTMGWVKEGEVDAKAQVLPDGKLAVYAWPDFQRGVEPLVKSVTARPVRASLDYDVWQVLGKHAAKTVVGAGLESVAPQLEETAKIYGPMEFKLFAPAQLQANSGRSVELKNERSEVHLEGSVNGERIFSRVRVISHFGEGAQSSDLLLDTLVQLTPGKTVVIGQNLAPEKTAGEATSLFYLVRASIAP